ncbi:uncharacterized protein L3040_002032 [Drepanopeziza brunnea f. sp. 'multigermtubi']|nr:hypothetical protein L3040_002032 [Drepanopeziza brunnea f. sp. 'multigermtubi']
MAANPSPNITAQQPAITPPPSTSTSTSEHSASTTNTISTTSPLPSNSDSTSNLPKTEAKTAAAPPPEDGRRNSQGQALPSPMETWKPSFARVQSWNREEFKRSAYVELGEIEEGRIEKEGDGMGG